MMTCEDSSNCELFWNENDPVVLVVPGAPGSLADRVLGG